MRVVNKNVESKRDIISELKNIKVNSTNKQINLCIICTQKNFFW